MKHIVLQKQSSPFLKTDKGLKTMYQKNHHRVYPMIQINNEKNKESINKTQNNKYISNKDTFFEINQFINNEFKQIKLRIQNYCKNYNNFLQTKDKSINDLTFKRKLNQKKTDLTLKSKLNQTQTNLTPNNKLNQTERRSTMKKQMDIFNQLVKIINEYLNQNKHQKYDTNQYYDRNQNQNRHHSLQLTTQNRKIEQLKIKKLEIALPNYQINNRIDKNISLLKIQKQYSSQKRYQNKKYQSQQFNTQKQFYLAQNSFQPKKQTFQKVRDSFSSFNQLHQIYSSTIPQILYKQAKLKTLSQFDLFCKTILMEKRPIISELHPFKKQNFQMTNLYLRQIYKKLSLLNTQLAYTATNNSSVIKNEIYSSYQNKKRTIQEQINQICIVLKRLNEVHNLQSIEFNCNRPCCNFEQNCVRSDTKAKIVLNLKQSAKRSIHYKTDVSEQYFNRYNKRASFDKNQIVSLQKTTTQQMQSLQKTYLDNRERQRPCRKKANSLFSRQNNYRS